MRSTLSDWEVELARWLKPFLDRLGHKARRRMCPLYVTGLIGPGDRKSVQPMAERLASGNYDQLHHFVGAGAWDAAPFLNLKTFLYALSFPFFRDSYQSISALPRSDIRRMSRDSSHAIRVSAIAIFGCARIDSRQDSI
jgi:hypothetical protein